MAVKSLHVLTGGPSVEIDKSLCTFMKDQGKRIQSAVLCYLIKADEGNILVDTGFSQEDVRQFMQRRGKEFNVSPELFLPEQLKLLGISTGDINFILLTHFHGDHIGCLSEFPHAEVVVQRMEYYWGLEPPNPAGGANRIFDKLKYRMYDGDQIFLPGITLLFTPGHSIGHQSVMVDLPKDGVIILAGDSAGLQENLDAEIIPTGFDSRQSLLSIKKLKVIAHARHAVIFPGHDIEFYRQKMRKLPEFYS